MKTVRFLIAVCALIAASTLDAGAQGFLDRLGKRVQQRAEEAITRKAEQAVDKAIDKATDTDTYTGDGGEAGSSQYGDDGAQGVASVAAAPQTPQQAQMAWNKFDFVSGDEIMFEDNLATEKLGEFPSMWDLKSGSAEVASIDGENAIYITQGTLIMPYMKEKDYLPDVFTIEFDVFVPRGRKEQTDALGAPEIGLNSRYNIDLLDASGDVVFQLNWYNGYDDNMNRPTGVSWEWRTGGDSNNHGSLEYKFKYNDFNRISISFNKRALKVYLNETRIVNIPRADAPSRFQVYAYQGDQEYRFIKDIRIAKGAVPLYDRMMSDGKFITYGITFDVGKSTIKPESMGEINRIVQLMNENPTLKFSVEGHTDSTGNAASNQTLSDARSAAVVAKLVELGIAADRLTSAGKGQNSPIADNSTDEGRAKNRRVEFVKI
ncbi:MAG: OmpA family protein [Rikenellaceae bacterium]|jgi:outer membrane protein OmpA-like peptidoglycan-associated protein|nr:OmpA family protein [Rikenellaceae bacterium]